MTSLSQFMEAVTGRRETLFLAGLSVAVLLIGAGSVSNKSEVYDEPWYMGAGYYLLKTGNFETESVWWHPPLPLYINSLPFYALDAAGMLPGADTVFKDGCQDPRCYRNRYSYLFMHGDRYKALNLLFLSRFSNLLLLPLTAIYLFRLLRRSFRFETAAVVTGLFALNPNVLAHASLATTDFAPACFGLISFYYYLELLKERSNTAGVKAGVTLGLALISKEVNAYLIPAYLLVAAYEIFSRARAGGHGMLFQAIKKSVPTLATPAAALTVSVILVVNAGYLFNGTPTYLISGFGTSEYPEVRAAYKLLAGVPLPMSKYMQLHYYVVDLHQRKGHETYLNGQAYGKAETPPRLIYWLTVITTKTPEGVLAILALSAVYYITLIRWRRNADSNARRMMLQALIVSAVAAVLVLYARTTIGVRLAMFAFPFVYLMMAEPVEYFVARSRMTRAMVYIFAAAAILPILLEYPDYIAYFNSVSGGPDNGYAYLSDSNIDWGQDLPGLRRYMEDNGVKNIKLAYFGRGWIEMYGINYTALPNNQGKFSGEARVKIRCGPTNGLIAVSVTAITGQYGRPGCYGWLRDVKPSYNIGHSILVYNITLHPGTRAPSP